MTFEQAIERMEQIISRLSGGNLGIDESVALYEEGVKLAAFCDEKIKEAQRKITLLQEKENV
ncbi:MAG: exodeoxyribonuclease VII small subunit [Clostridia bacterium]|nr:exodeoxyribonuclease VII small subunit [Clostridia bacterium]MBQ4628218.1 exodeoxyribonuclease VII small subunit [Clostridia bacterium]